MDAHTQEQHQKDFMAAFFSTDSTSQVLDGQQQSMYPYTAGNYNSTGMQQALQQNNTNHPPVNVDFIHIENASTQSSYNPQSLLEQQFKLTQLQQLQQLQNQIFQQQIALISGQSAGVVQNSAEAGARREQPSTQFSGLPTPGPSGELHPQTSMEYVSPMSLNSYLDQHQEFRNSNVDHISTSIIGQSMNSNYLPPRGSTSAPEHIAFRTSPLHHSLPSPADLDFDISPLTSPWLGAHQQSMHTSANKRQASSSDDENGIQPSRKKPSPAIRPTNPAQSKKLFRGSKSTNCTPLLRSSRSRKGSTAGEVPGDTPSPVDLSMPPPAPPVPHNPAIPSSSSSFASNVSQDINDMPPSPNFNAQLTPVTPASIMNLGRLGINSSLAPPSRQVLPPKPDAKAKGAAKQTKSNGEALQSSSRTRTPRKSASGSLVSPGLKAILPAGTAPSSSLITSTPLAASVPGVHGRKTSHKAAEQKRRDSLKSTFDDLRLLLPPIPLPSSDDRFADDPLLPGALPPRGPPKAGGEGPNKGVSKLQLLMCGNDYLRMLKARVERRDEEIEKLRREVKRLRLRCGGSVCGGMGGGGDVAEELDLERDLDAIEAFGPELGTSTGSLAMANNAGDDEADDDPGGGD